MKRKISKRSQSIELKLNEVREFFADEVVSDDAMRAEWRRFPINLLKNWFKSDQMEECSPRELVEILLEEGVYAAPG